MPRRCEHYMEWWNTGGLGSTCILPFAHEGDHSDGNQTWHRTGEESRLIEEIKRLRALVAEER